MTSMITINSKTPRRRPQVFLTPEEYYQDAKKKLPNVLWDIVVGYTIPGWFKHIRTQLINGIIEKPLTTEQDLEYRLQIYIRDNMDKISPIRGEIRID